MTDATIPASHRDLLSRARRLLGHLALVTSRGEPHVTPIWFDFDGELVILNTARGRVKDRIMRRHPVIALEVSDPADPARYIQMRGPVVFESEEGAFAQICDLREKYDG